MQASDDGVFLVVGDDIRVGAIARAAAERWRALMPRVRSVSIAAILIRRRSDEGPEFQNGLRRDAWQVVIPEITLDGGVDRSS